MIGVVGMVEVGVVKGLEVVRVVIKVFSFFIWILRLGVVDCCVLVVVFLFREVEEELLFFDVEEVMLVRVWESEVNVVYDF